ncbi:MAG: type IV pilin protein [Elusimicrobiota bacterium]
MIASNRRGYTLIELVVTVLIIGILTSIAVPQYLKTVEVGKADDAAATVNMIGTTNKMFALDHGGIYVAGGFTTIADGSCDPVGVCPMTVPYSNACDLVWCKYLANQSWANKPYTYTAIDGAVAPNNTASAARVVGGTYGTTTGSPYAGWGYTSAVTGVITAVGTAPPPTY